MSITMDRELLIRLPSPLYERVKTVCGRQYKSISSFVRELLLERLDDTLSASDLKEIEKGHKFLKQSKGVSWRKIKRG